MIDNPADTIVNIQEYIETEMLATQVIKQSFTIPHVFLGEPPKQGPRKYRNLEPPPPSNFDARHHAIEPMYKGVY